MLSSNSTCGTCIRFENSVPVVSSRLCSMLEDSLNDLSGVAFFRVSYSGSYTTCASSSTSTNSSLLSLVRALSLGWWCLLGCVLGRGAEAAASGLCPGFGGPEERGPQRGSEGPYGNSNSGNGNMKPVTRTSGGGAYERPRTDSLLDGGEAYNQVASMLHCPPAAPLHVKLPQGNTAMAGFPVRFGLCLGLRVCCLWLGTAPS